MLRLLTGHFDALFSKFECLEIYSNIKLHDLFSPPLITLLGNKRTSTDDRRHTNITLWQRQRRVPRTISHILIQIPPFPNYGNRNHLQETSFSTHYPTLRSSLDDVSRRSTRLKPSIQTLNEFKSHVSKSTADILSIYTTFQTELSVLRSQH